MVTTDGALFNNPDMMPGTESIVYTQTGTTGSPWTFNAQVFREIPEAAPGLPAQTLPNITVFIDKDAGPSAIRIGTDTVTVAVEFGGTAVPQVVTGIITQDAGGWLLSLSH
jgi:hypothetical protein